MEPSSRNRPRDVIVRYRGMPYRLDLGRCRRALVLRQVDGHFDNMESLAQVIGCSRSTVSRFFSGRNTSLSVTLRLLRALRLSFEDVTTVEGDPHAA
jgi:hypothetical protein